MATSFLAQMIITLAKGIVGKTATLTFKPVMKTGKKCLATRPCGCGYKHAVVFRAVENADMYAVVCPKCKGTTYVNAKSTAKAETPAKDTCAGITTKGKPCTKKATANGYCHLHQDQHDEYVAPTATEEQETRF